MTTLYGSNRISGIRKTQSIDPKVKERLRISGIKEIYWAEVEDPVLKKSFVHHNCFVIEYTDDTYNVFSFGQEGYVKVYKAINTAIDSDTFIELLYGNAIKQLV